MNPTHDQDNTDRGPGMVAPVTRILDLADLLSDGGRFRTMLTAGLAALADDGVSALIEHRVTEPDSTSVAQPDPTPSTAPVDLVTETDDETTARVLRSAATYLERHGWIQGAYCDATSGSFTPAACMVGAIGMVCYGGPVDAPSQHFDDPGFLDFEQAVLHLDRYLLVENSSESYEFNDARGRRLEDVTHVLREASSRPAHELIDALRVIDRQNADMASLSAMLIPGGTFAAGGTDGGDVR